MNLHIGLGTTFMEGRALDKLASIRGGASTGFRIAVAGGPMREVSKILELIVH
jgi:hypothetical protein